MRLEEKRSKYKVRDLKNSDMGIGLVVLSKVLKPIPSLNSGVHKLEGAPTPTPGKGAKAPWNFEPD